MPRQCRNTEASSPPRDAGSAVGAAKPGQGGSRVRSVQAQVQAGDYEVSAVLVAERMIDLALARARRRKAAAPGSLPRDTPEAAR